MSRPRHFPNTAEYMMFIHIQSPSIVKNLFKYFKGYLGTLGDIDVHSATLTGAQLKWRGEASPFFFEN